MGVIVGTAGHIDHGKSMLVKYLTGSDPDRLKEEKDRGITIELGYVFMPLPDGGLLSFIDVPGHENFVRQMVAGTATVDCFLLVVAADEGIMPQTREHLDILRLLDVRRGLVALTKCDLVDPEMQELVQTDVMDHLSESVFEGTPVYRVSSVTGEGMEELRSALVGMALDTGRRSTGDRFRLDIDRVFVLEGFGTIVAGTVISGTVAPGMELEVQPGGRRYRVREMRVNTRKGVPAANAGDRVALNLSGLRRDETGRGCVLAEPGYVKVRESLDTELTLLDSANPLRKYQRVRFHTGTAEVMARAIPVEEGSLRPGRSGFVHFQLESPVAALPGDRFVVRNFSPVVTIGGGVILETGTRKVRRKYVEDRLSHLEIISSGDTENMLAEMLQKAGIDGISAEEAAGAVSLPLSGITDTLLKMRDAGKVFLSGSGPSMRAVITELFDEASKKLLKGLADHHERNPVSPGLRLSEPSRVLQKCPQWLVRAVVEDLLRSGVMEKRDGRLSLAGHPREIPPDHLKRVRETMARVDSAGNAGLPLEELSDRALTDALIERGMLVELSGSILITSERIASVFDGVRKRFAEKGFTLAELRNHLGTSRKDALKWAELFDAQGMTVRRGDRRTFRG